MMCQTGNGGRYGTPIPQVHRRVQAAGGGALPREALARALRALGHAGPGVAGVGVRQRDDEQLEREALSGHHGLEVVVVDLRGPRRPLELEIALFGALAVRVSPLAHVASRCGVGALVAPLRDQPVIDALRGMALLARCARIGLENGIDPCAGAEVDMSAISAYLATVLRLSPSLLAISARGTPAASITLISLTSSRGTVISSILSGRVRPKPSPGKTIRRGPRPWFLGCGPHDQNAQFLMRTVLKSRRSFGPILIAHQHCGVRCPRRTGAARRGCGRGARRAAGAEVP